MNLEHSLPETNIMAESLMTVRKKINILSKIVPYSSLTFAVEEDKRLHGVNETKVGPRIMYAEFLTNSQKDANLPIS